MRRIPRLAGHLRAPASPATQQSMLWTLLRGEGELHAPRVARLERERAAFGVSWSDPYAWMETDCQAFDLHLRAEQRHNAAWMRRAGLPDAAERVRLRAARFAERPEEGPVTGAKERLGPWLYYTRAAAGQAAERFVRAPVGGGPEQIVLDVSALAEAAGEPVEIGQMKLSDCQALLAHTQQAGGGEPEAVVTEIATGRTLDRLQGVCGMEWLRGERWLLYTAPAEPGSLRPARVLRHALGTPQSADTLLLEERDGACFLSLTRTKDGCFVCVNSSSKTASEVHLQDAAQPLRPLLLVQRRTAGLEYFAEHHSGTLLLLTNAFGGPGLSLATAPLGSPGRRHWRPALPPQQQQPDTVTEDLDVFRSCLVLWQRTAGRPGLTVVPVLPSPGGAAAKGLQLGQPQQLSLAPDAPEAPLAVRPGANADFGGSCLQLHASSLVGQERSVSVDLRTLEVKHSASRWRAQLPQAFRCWQEWAVSADGTKVPLTVAAPPPGQRSGGCLLRLYGAYGTSLEPEFCPATAALLEQGWAVALAHVRGGGELGRRWHHAGRQRGKLAALEDARACQQRLEQLRLAAPGCLALQASSAGGVLAAHLLLQQPAAFCGAALRMPFLDLFTAMTDASSPLTQHEWEEWGDPREAGGAALLRRLCPYQALQQLQPSTAQRWPPILLTVGRTDDRVPAWGPAKWAAALRHRLGPQAQVCLHVTEGGHFLPPEEEVELAAIEAAFLTHSCKAAQGR